MNGTDLILDLLRHYAKRKDIDFVNFMTDLDKNDPNGTDWVDVVNRDIDVMDFDCEYLGAVTNTPEVFWLNALNDPNFHLTNPANTLNRYMEA